MKDSEILNTFDESRDEFKPYGLTCELWKPQVMGRPDRHNEIEINYFPEGTITYLFQDSRIKIPAKRLALFWGLIPHQIVNYEGNAPYYVCTIPFSLFLEWKLPSFFVDRILKGEVIVEASEETWLYNEYLMENWINEVEHEDTLDVMLLELRARLNRLAHSKLSAKESSHVQIHSNDISHVERIAVFIAENFDKPIEVSDVGKAVGLHPDYANSIFKKAFDCTLSEYINEERISHAQQKLITKDANISSIAYDCGFNSISWFNAQFKKINDCTPREYRKRNSPKL